ncbi:MAG: universal stress protein [Thermoleophilia bacterium]
MADGELADVPGLERLPGAPLDALLAAAAEADLVVVGSRGLHGVAALGSVSERLAHRAGCSALVVR